MSKLYDILNSLIARVKSVEAQSANGGQPDWNQNDETASDYIKNRPFYEGLSVLLPETTLTFTNSQYAGNLGLNFEEGETYTIVWDGVEYECKASYFDNGEMHGNVLGNFAAVGGTNTGEPFFIGTAAGGDGYTMAACLTGATSATLKVLDKAAKKLDDKYLSDNVIRTEVVSKVIIPETAFLNGGENNGIHNWMLIIRDGIEPLVEGEIYRVTWNGREYIEKAKKSPTNTDGILAYIGDSNFLNPEYSGVYAPPFILYIDEEMGVGAGTTFSDDTAVIKIEHITETTNKPIPWDAISDKPFYESMSEFLPETEFTFSGGQYFSEEYAGADFVVGKTYKVIWNGVEYSCVAFMGEGIMIGNVSLLTGTGDTGEPFVIATYSPNSVLNIISLAGETSATVKIMSETVKKLDEKFLPRNIVYGDLDNGWLYKDIGLTTYCTKDEIIALGTNFEVSIVDTEMIIETGQLCKPLLVMSEGVDSCATIYMYYLDKNGSIKSIFMRTDGYMAAPV